MNILYYTHMNETYMDQWQIFHIINELQHYNWNIEIFNSLECESTEYANEQILHKLRTGKYSLFMTPYNEKHIYVETLRKIREYGIKSLLICFDNLLIPYVHKKICKEFDLVWLTSKENEEKFQKWGGNTIFLPYAANPYLFQPNFKEIEKKVVFIGSPYGSRTHMINTLSKGQISIDLYSKDSFEGDDGKQVVDYCNYIFALRNYIRFKEGRKIVYAAIKLRIEKQGTLQ